MKVEFATWLGRTYPAFLYKIGGTAIDAVQVPCMVCGTEATIDVKELGRWEGLCGNCTFQWRWTKQGLRDWVLTQKPVISDEYDRHLYALESR